MGVGTFHCGFLRVLPGVSLIMTKGRNSLHGRDSVTLHGFSSMENCFREHLVNFVCFHIVRIYSVRILFHLYLEKVACFGNSSFVMRIHMSQIPLSEVLWAKLHAV